MQKSILPLLLMQVVTLSSSLESPRIRGPSQKQHHHQRTTTRVLQDEYEKDRPCLGEDGNIHYMDETFDFGDWDFVTIPNGGDRRLGDSFDGIPDECPKEQLGGAVDTNATEFLDVNASSPYPAPTTVAPYGVVAPQPTAGVPHPTAGVQQPVPQPVPVHPTNPQSEEDEFHLPPDFRDPDMRKLLFCKVSAALPINSRRHLQGGGGGGSGGGGGGGGRGSGSESSDEDDIEEQEATARRFLKHVGSVMAKEIERFSNHSFMVREGPQGFRRLQKSPRELRPYRPPLDYVEFDGIILLGSPLHSNVSHLEGVRAPRRTMWWDYTMAFWTVHENFTYTEEMVGEATMDSIKSGEFFRRLRFHFPRLVAVSVPGEELTHLKGPPLDDESPEGTPASPLDVQEWDTRRWVGLGMFFVTLLLMMLLSVTAKRRRRKVQQQENWGVGLSTEKDINQLLTYGWDYDGQMFHAFDKNKLVYRDDDSMLIGGALLGDIGAAPTAAETPRTDASPSSRSQSSRSRSSRSRSSRSGVSKSLNGSTARTGTDHESSERSSGY